MKPQLLQTFKMRKNRSFEYGPQIEVVVHDCEINVISREWLRINGSNEGDLIVMIRNKLIKVPYCVSSLPLSNGVGLILSRTYLSSVSKAGFSGTASTACRQSPGNYDNHLKEPRTPQRKSYDLSSKKSAGELSGEPSGEHERPRFVSLQQVAKPEGASVSSIDKPLMTPQQISCAFKGGDLLRSKEVHVPLHTNEQRLKALKDVFTLHYLETTMQYCDMAYLLSWKSGKDKTDNQCRLEKPEKPYVDVLKEAAPTRSLMKAP